MLRRKGIQCADVNVADGIAFAGADGGQMAAGNDGQRPIAAQRAGLLILLLIIVADGVQQLLLFFPDRSDRPGWSPARAGVKTAPDRRWRPACRRAAAAQSARSRRSPPRWCVKKARISRDSLSIATESWLPASTTRRQPVCCNWTTKRLYSSRA